ncbi:hypothetical protein M5K25_011448 [Dendrobium thyrsiflorum]|uniref:Uncharacterized protein n=1 Tax=Dendrobium thyrsiflorum TaxID=117978 RepID=A0ABD0V2R8_DENTH
MLCSIGLGFTWTEASWWSHSIGCGLEGSRVTDWPEVDGRAVSWCRLDRAGEGQICEAYKIRIGSEVEEIFSWRHLAWLSFDWCWGCWIKATKGVARDFVRGSGVRRRRELGTDRKDSFIVVLSASGGCDLNERIARGDVNGISAEPVHRISGKIRGFEQDLRRICAVVLSTGSRERIERLQQAKEHWESQCRAFMGI